MLQQATQRFVADDVLAADVLHGDVRRDFAADQHVAKTLSRSVYLVVAVDC